MAQCVGSEPTKMPYSRRPKFSTPLRGRNTNGRPADAMAVANAAMSLLTTSMTSPQPTPRPPSGATPDKCDMEMSSSGFRTWRRSVETWLRLAGWPDHQAILHIRLLCTPTLQCALDARFTTAQWDGLTSKEALDAIGKLVLRAANQAVRWAEFFSAHQSPGEAINNYMTRCGQEVVDCGFACPQCNGDIS